MSTTNKVLAVSIIALATVSVANATIVSETMLSKTAGKYDKDNTVEMAINAAQSAGTGAAAGALAAAQAAQATADAAVVANTTAMTSGTYTKVTVDSKGLVTAGSTLSASDIPTIAESKVTNLVSDLAAKQTTANMVTAESGATYDKTSTTTYPSMKTAAKIASDAAASAVSGAAGNYDASGTAAGLINALDVSTSGGSGNVVTAVTQTDGKISVTKGTTLGGLATKDAVSSSEITDGTIVNDDISSSAAIAPSKIATSSSNRFVSDTEKSTWNGKQAALTTAQLNAANSGITSAKVSTYDGYASGKQDKLVASGTGQNIIGTNNVSVDIPSEGDNAGKIVISGPTLPTVNNATLTIQKNGTTIDTFTANSSSDKTVNITVPTKASDISAVPTSRTVNGSALSSNVTLDGSNVKVATGYAQPSTASAVAAGDTINAAIGKLEKQIAGKQAAGSYVTTGRTVNGKALSSDVTLTGADVATTGYAKASTAAAITAGDSVNVALGKLEKALDGKQATMTVDTAMSSTSTNPVQNKVVNSALSGKVSTSRTVNGKALSSDVTLAGSDVKVTGYAKADAVAAIATTDTVNQALGKLEKALDGKQASGSYEASGTAAGLINALDVSTSSGSGNVVTAVTQTDGKISVTKGTTLGGLATKSSVSSSEITDGTIVNADISGTAAIAVSKIDGAEASANKVTATTGYDTTSTTSYPSMATTQAMITSSISTNNTTLAGQINGKQAKSAANYNMGNSSGGWTAMTTQQQNMLNGKVPVGAESGSSVTDYASVWVE